MEEFDFKLLNDDELNLVSSVEETNPSSEPKHKLPTVQTYNNYHWPTFLQQIIDKGNTPAQKDALLLSAVTAIGAVINSKLRTHYNGKWYYACLMTFVVAPPASGKGALSWVRRLVEPLHDEIRQEVDDEYASYRQMKAAYDAAGKAKSEMDVPVAPRNRMFIISANNSGTGMMENIMDAEGRCIIFETEADTLSTSLNQDYNHGSDVLRNTFDHERISYNRRTDHEYRELKETYLSMVLSGTPNQVKSLIPSAENGLFSRFLYYYMPSINHWEDQFGVKIDMNDWFTKRGEELRDLAESLKDKESYTLELSDFQINLFNDRFNDLFISCRKSLGLEAVSSVLRLAPEILRIMSIVAFLRNIEERSDRLVVDDGIFTLPPVLNIADMDFIQILNLADVLMQHTVHILSILPPVEVQSRDTIGRQQLFNALCHEFTAKELADKAYELEINPNTARTWLKRAVESHMVSKIGKGKYVFEQ